ncbi:DUF4145 domain-containing protein [Paenibacillus glucanolyticus]|uniref:DUF4145 domain-containing protein n=1 Tax=Paenibacillus glucanolyticus TaxID=59843 RepID=UPI0030C9AB1D
MKVYCSKCRNQTNHKVIFEHKEVYTPESYPEMQIDYAEGKWQVIQCQGCEDISFREVWLTSEDFDPFTGEASENITLYPLRDKDSISVRRFEGLPRKLRKIYQEVIESYNNNLLILCAAGLRALVEGICSLESINERNLQKKIEGLFTKGLLTKQHSDILHEHRFMGNSAVHELDMPSKEELSIAIKIIEHTIENLYELREQIEELRWLKQRRKKD